jgi:hypothetical protein
MDSDRRTISINSLVVQSILYLFNQFSTCIVVEPMHGWESEAVDESKGACLCKWRQAHLATVSVNGHRAPRKCMSLKIIYRVGSPKTSASENHRLTEVAIRPYKSIFGGRHVKTTASINQ